MVINVHGLRDNVNEPEGFIAIAILNFINDLLRDIIIRFVLAIEEAIIINKATKLSIIVADQIVTTVIMINFIEVATKKINFEDGYSKLEQKLMKATQLDESRLKRLI